MTQRLLSALEILFLRAAPGVLQVLSILLTARYLSIADYGVFSTGIATTTFIAAIAVGPIRFAILPLHASFATRGEGAEFEHAVIALLLLATFFVLCAGGLLWWIGFTNLSWVALAASSALFLGWNPVMQARLQFWRYGITAMVQAVLLIVLLQMFLPTRPEIDTAGWAFATSYALGFIVSWFLCDAPIPREFSRNTLHRVVDVGASFTVSNVAESGLYLGTRYAMLWFGSVEFLSLFSFAVDLAQRSVGVVFNIVTFALVPRAYRVTAERQEEGGAFRALLIRGVAVSLAVSLLVFVLILVLEAIGFMEHFLTGPFSLAAFCAVSAAIVINRLKKLALDPFAVHTSRHRAIPLAYATIAPPALALSFLACYVGQEWVVLIVYPIAYLGTAILTALAIRRRRSGPAMV